MALFARVPGGTRRARVSSVDLPRGAGFTLVEGLICAAILALVVSILNTIYVSAGSSTSASVEASDALRSVLIAGERLRHDVSRMMFQSRTDLAILDGGHGLSFLVSEPIDGDLWGGQGRAVTYTLRRVERKGDLFWLVRRDVHGESTVSGCLLKDLTVKHLPRGRVSPLQAYLEITMIGAGSLSPKRTYTGSILIPITPIELPMAHVKS